LTLQVVAEVRIAAHSAVGATPVEALLTEFRAWLAKE
jgi:hypothetical protein